MRRRETVELDPAFLTLTRPSGADPYKALVLAIVERALQDAAGHVSDPGAQGTQHLAAEAQAWLAEGVGQYLLRLAGYEPAALPALTPATCAEKEG